MNLAMSKLTDVYYYNIKGSSLTHFMLWYFSVQRLYKPQKCQERDFLTQR